MNDNGKRNVATSVTESGYMASLVERLKDVEKGTEVDFLIGIIMEQAEKIEELTKKYNAAQEEIAHLKSILNNNSSNTSLPPSTDRKKSEKRANQYNGRTKSGKKAGGQAGHKGKTLTKEEVEKRLASGKYKYELVVEGERRTGPYITRYELDLEVTPVIREIRIYANKDGAMEIPERYYSEVTYGDKIKSLAVHMYAAGVVSNDRIAEFLNEASGVDLDLSEGSVYNFCAHFARKSEKYIGELEQEQSQEGVLCTDATCTSTNGARSYIRCISSKAAVIYYAMESKSVAALEKIGLLAGYHGILMHDHETAIYHFGQGHAECNVHILRYLRKNTEDTGNKWSDKMIDKLTEMNEARKAVIAAGKESFSADDIQKYEDSYTQIIKEGRKENNTTEHDYAKKRETALLNRMENYKENHLLFLHNFDVPFDDNMSERDLRKAKNRQKMTGGFRKHSGLDMYCKILTIIETARRKQTGIMAAIRNIFSGSPAVFQAV